MRLAGVIVKVVLVFNRNVKEIVETMVSDECMVKHNKDSKRK